MHVQCLLGLLLVFVPMQARQQEQRATVTFAFVDALGSPLELLGSTLDLTNTKNPKTHFETRGNTVNNVPFGEYEVLVVVPKFGAGKRRLLVNNHNIWALVTVDVGSVEPPRRELSGHVHGSFSRAPGWIKAVSLYRDVFKETPLDKDGRFSIPNLPFGDYVLIIMQNNQQCDIRVVRVAASSPPDIEIDLTGVAACK